MIAKFRHLFPLLKRFFVDTQKLKWTARWILSPSDFYFKDELDG